MPSPTDRLMRVRSLDSAIAGWFSVSFLQRLLSFQHSNADANTFHWMVESYLNILWFSSSRAVVQPMSFVSRGFKVLWNDSLLRTTSQYWMLRLTRMNSRWRDKIYINLAHGEYVIYTSDLSPFSSRCTICMLTLMLTGTTGPAKRVDASHQTVANLLCSSQIISAPKPAQ